MYYKIIISIISLLLGAFNWFLKHGRVVCDLQIHYDNNKENNSTPVSPMIPSSYDYAIEKEHCKKMNGKWDDNKKICILASWNFNK